jgi:hypothetical protein
MSKFKITRGKRIMTNTINNTNNPLVILACLLALALTALLRSAARLAGAALYAVGRAAGSLLAHHWRLLALLALPVVAVIAVNLTWPVVVAIAGKVAMASVGMTAFTFGFKP